MSQRTSPPIDISNASRFLSGYCERIGYTEILAPTVKVLRTLMAKHIAVIAYENIDVLLGRGIDISAEAVDAKMVGNGRGGYCYEHNGLFKRVLAEIGFPVQTVAARVRWAVPEGATLPRTHMALIVQAEAKSWIVDVGFGGLGPAAPLELDAIGPQPTNFETYRVVPSGNIRLVQAHVQDNWATLYEMSLDPLQDIDFEPLNWFISTSPRSVFRNNLMLARAEAGVRYTLKNRLLSVRQKDGSYDRREIALADLPSVFKLFSIQYRPEWEAPFIPFLTTEP